MAKTEHNAINTLWRGKVGGFQYRVVRGKQVISGAVSHITNRKTPKQLDARGRFKAAIGFTDMWLPLLKANMRKVENDAFEARTKICKIALGAAEYVDGEGRVDMEEFVSEFNWANKRRASVDLDVEFDGMAGRISVPAGQVVVYEVAAYERSGKSAWWKTFAFVSDGEARETELPTGVREVGRIELMAFNVTMYRSAEWEGPVGEIWGKSTRRKREGNYGKLLEALSARGCRIHGVVGGVVVAE
ncbi:MAG: hypothetical protein J5711_09825 [Bacteroidales bacterium]|nr:hypothetical protein [Bacteroidales bacterium]